MKKNTHELRIQLAKAMYSQGYGPHFSPKLEKRINALKKKINADKSHWVPSVYG